MPCATRTSVRAAERRGLPPRLVPFVAQDMDRAAVGASRRSWRRVARAALEGRIGRPRIQKTLLEALRAHRKIEDRVKEPVLGG